MTTPPVLEEDDDIDLRESRLRSFLKAVSYRIVGTIATATITWLVTGDIGAAIAMGTVEPFAKIIIYYFHERAWQALPRGSIRSLLRQR